jgi:hypothetical protein
MTISEGSALAACAVVALALAACAQAPTGRDAGTTPPGNQVAPTELREIVEEAYVYGFPMVDSYRIQHSYFVDRAHPEYKGAWNQPHSVARVFTPRDKAIQTPNSDTPYTFLGADLRAEPLVISVPAVPKSRYYSLQFIDMYTHNFAYVGSRSLPDQLDHGTDPDSRRRRRHHAVHPARVARHAQGGELAARAQWSVLHGPARVLAEARGAERVVEGAAGRARPQVTSEASHAVDASGAIP